MAQAQPKDGIAKDSNVGVENSAGKVDRLEALDEGALTLNDLEPERDDNREHDGGHHQIDARCTCTHQERIESAKNCKGGRGWQEH